MYAKASYKILQRAMHIHPTVAEFIPTLLNDLKPLWASAAHIAASCPFAGTYILPRDDRVWPV